MEARYSIKDLENFTQIKAHTLRIWEQRYKLLTPHRTDTNIRYYTEADLKKILNVNLLYTRGYKISRIASMSETEIRNTAQELIEDVELAHQADVDKLLVSILQFDEAAIQEQLRSLTASSDFLKTYRNVIIPLLQRIGELWQVDALEVAHEHFFSKLYRDYVITMRNELPNPPSNAPMALLFLHEKEDHEFSLLLYNYILKMKGYRTAYLGQRVPTSSLAKAIQSVKPDLIVTTFISIILSKDFVKLTNTLDQAAAASTVLISGAQAEFLSEYIPPTFRLIRSMDELDTTLSQHLNS